MVTMVTLELLLIVALIVAGVASVATVALVLLIGMFLGMKDIHTSQVEAKAKKEEDDNGVFTVPISALGGGVPRTITQADVDQVRAQMAAHRAAVEGAGEEKKPEYEPGKGASL